jgi:hypothetical protein
VKVGIIKLVREASSQIFVDTLINMPSTPFLYSHTHSLLGVPSLIFYSAMARFHDYNRALSAATPF